MSNRQIGCFAYLFKKKNDFLRFSVYDIVVGCCCHFCRFMRLRQIYYFPHFLLLNGAGSFHFLIKSNNWITSVSLCKLIKISTFLPHQLYVLCVAAFPMTVFSSFFFTSYLTIAFFNDWIPMVSLSSFVFPHLLIQCWYICSAFFLK